LLKSAIWVVISGKKGESFMKQKKIWAVIVLLSAVQGVMVALKNMVIATAGKDTGV